MLGSRTKGVCNTVARGFPSDSAGKQSTCNAGDLGLIPGLGRSPWEGKGYPFQYSGLENSRGCMTMYDHVWPWGHKEPDRTERISLLLGASLVAHSVKSLPEMQETQIQSLGQEDPWRRKWQPTPIFWPGKSCGWRILAGCSPWGCRESDMTEQLRHNNMKVYLFFIGEPRDRLVIQVW